MVLFIYFLFYKDHCFDGNKTEDETGVDCGGSCRPCSGLCLMKNRTKVYRLPRLIVIIIKIDIFITKYHSLQISVTLVNKMGMKLELIVEVAVPRVVVSIIVIMYINLVLTVK